MNIKSLSIDNGYGYTKSYPSNIKFKSTVKLGVDNYNEDVIQVEYDNQNYIVGENNNSYNNDQDKLISRFGRTHFIISTLVSIGLSYSTEKEIELDLCLGTPSEYYEKQRHGIVDLLKNKEFKNYQKEWEKLCKENGGLSDARNYGVDYVTGDYLLFIDSDDFITNNCIETFVELIKKYPDSDVILGSATFYPNAWGSFCLNVKNSKIPSYSNNKRWLNSSFFKNDFLPVTAWNKLVSKKFILKNNLFFNFV